VDFKGKDFVTNSRLPWIEISSQLTTHGRLGKVSYGWVKYTQVRSCFRYRIALLGEER